MDDDPDNLADLMAMVSAILATGVSLTDFYSNVVGDDVVVDIYGPPGLPEEFEIRPAMFFLGTGGSGDENLPIGKESVDFYCYGRDAAEANFGFRILRRFLHRRKHHIVTINGKNFIFQYAKIMAGPQDRTDPQEGWNLVYSSFMIDYIEVAVP